MDLDKKERIKESIKGKLRRHFGKTLEEAGKAQIYKACAMTVRDEIMDKWITSRCEVERKSMKRLYYLSVEFLMGRALVNNMINILSEKEYIAALNELGADMDEISECEADAGLGNGGLGRLAACFLDSLATLELPAMGCGIRYEYGLFKQKIVDGEQFETSDNWLDDDFMWEVMVPEEQQEVRFGGTVTEEWLDGGLNIKHEGYTSVMAVPYDVPIPGYDSRLPSTLRLWSAKSPVHLDMESFSRGEYAKAVEEKELAEVISKVLYPEDKHIEGKQLRLKQHYFFTSATIQYIIKEFKKNHSDLRKLPDYVAIQINDTHPALAIPEMMRILLDEEGMDWDSAERIVRKTFAYTNHTVMSEALEKWPEDMMRTILPRIHSITAAINEKYCSRLWEYYPGQWEKIGAMAIISHNEVRMANLSIAMSHSVNGVSQLHANILKKGIFRDFYVIEPAKFKGITNGITHRRWLMKSNPALTSLITESIGEGWIKEPERLSELKPFADDAAFRQKFGDIKRQNKERLAKWFKQKQCVDLNVDAIFDVQAKRLHEYKRQLLNVLNILQLYNEICENPTMPVQPRVHIFGAKASPGYVMAKQIIRLINSVAEKVNGDPRCKGKLQVVFLENYGVSAAEVLIPAADVSEQISAAGKEASGTGNMKFMMNGALTIGTMDGANVEICEAVGEENMFIFGLSADEAEQLSSRHEYRAGSIYETDSRVRHILEQLIDGSLPMNRAREFSDIYHSLLFSDYGMADKYFVLKDFNSYYDEHKKINEAYADKDKWLKMTVLNTASSGVFSSDRTISYYNRLIWKLKRYE
ncbi:MAG: glycogen/starch/alpha-glucan phosphorylase [Christensenellales bacterium]|jgi:starch phosphorylase